MYIYPRIRIAHCDVTSRLPHATPSFSSKKRPPATADVFQKSQIATIEELGRIQLAGKQANQQLDKIRQGTLTVTPQEEKSLNQQLLAGRKALEALVLRNQKLVYSVLNALLEKHPSPIPYEDLLYVGTKGLIDAAGTFDPAKGKFSTVAWRRIDGEIKTLIQKEAALNQVSLNVPLDEEEDGTTPLDLLVDPTPSVKTRIFQTELAEILNHALSELPPKSREAVKAYYGLGDDDPLTYEAIAEKQGLGGKVHARYYVQEGLKRLQNNPKLRDLLADLQIDH